MKKLLKLVIGLLLLSPLAFADVGPEFEQSEQVTDASFHAAASIAWRPLLAYAPSTGGVHLLPNIIVIKPTGLAGGGSGGGGGGLTTGGAITGGTNSTVCFKDSSGNFQCSATVDGSAVTSFRLADGVKGTPSFAFAASPTIGFYRGTNGMTFNLGANNVGTLYGNGFFLPTASLFGWMSTADSDAGTANAYFGSPGANTITASPLTFVQNTGGVSRVSSDVPNATTTFAVITGLSHTVTSGRKYAGRLHLFVNDSTAADGIKFDANGGAATMTSFKMNCYQTTGGTVVIGTAASTSLAGVVNFTTITGETLIECVVAFVPSSTNTIIFRMAQNAHTAGTATVEANSFVSIEDIP